MHSGMDVAATNTLLTDYVAVTYRNNVTKVIEYLQNDIKKMIGNYYSGAAAEAMMDTVFKKMNAVNTDVNDQISNFAKNMSEDIVELEQTTKQLAAENAS